AVIASSTYTLDNWPCHCIAKRLHAKYIYEIHDLWPLSPMELGGMSAKHPFIRLMQWGEDYAYRHADKVVSILPCVHEHVQEHGLPLEKLALVPNGVVEEDWLPENQEALPEEHRQLLEKLQKENRLLVGFAGAHGIANALKPFIDAMRLLPAKQAAFVLIGTGLEKERLKAYVVQENIHDVYFLPPVSKKAIPSLLTEFDLLYVGLQKQSLFRFGISPNKIFDYMMAGKPIIMAIEAGNDLIKDADCGWRVAPENPDAIAQTIRTAAACQPEELERLGQNGFRYVHANHTYRHLAQAFIQAIETI
ncbi:MAG: glycosyltransferase family 4 protein, partial [Bacteroidales bacterium]|nr:glycosyltransferase family 4 protein [Bacteroidales bacterium]